MASIAALSFLVFASVACGPRITNQNVAVVNRQKAALEKAGKSLTPKEVESILGLPTRMETFSIPLETRRPILDGVRYFYEQGNETLELHFVDNKLISDIPKLAEPNAAGATATK
jgi:hypothetical protein